MPYFDAKIASRKHTPRGIHVALEASGIKHGGGAHVLVRIVDALLADPRFGRVTLFASAAPDRRFALPHDPRLVIIEPPLSERPGWRVLWLEAGLAQHCGELKPDVVWCLNGVGFVGELPQVNLLQQPLLFMPGVLRSMPLLFQARMRVIRSLTRASCRRAQRIIVQTPTIAALASSTFELPLSTLRVHTPDIVWSETERITQAASVMRLTPADRRVLYVGSDITYKRLHMLVACVTKLRRVYPELRLFATIPPGHPLARHVAVYPLGALSAGEVKVCMELATMLVMPSLAETVGLPMLEAMSVGCPVLASDLPYAHDVCHGAALFFAPDQLRSCAHHIAQLLEDPITRHQLAGRGRLRTEYLRRQRPYERMLDVVTNTVSDHVDRVRTSRGGYS